MESNPEPEDPKDWMADHSPDPGDDLPVGTTTLFSPRKGAKMLKMVWRTRGGEGQARLFTAAFGLNAQTNAMHAQLVEARDHLRFILMEKDEDNILPALHLKDPNISVAVGSVLGRDGRQREIPGWDLQNWHREIHFRGTRGHVFYVHQKFLVVDPLGDDPLVFAGSANFSKDSLSNNDENMLLIRGDKRRREHLFHWSLIVCSDISCIARLQTPTSEAARWQMKIGSWRSMTAGWTSISGMAAIKASVAKCSNRGRQDCVRFSRYCTAQRIRLLFRAVCTICHPIGA